MSNVDFDGFDDFDVEAVGTELSTSMGAWLTPNVT
jgi:hypothetical protein